MGGTNTNGKTNTCVLAVSVSSYTHMSLPYRCAVLPTVVRPSVPFLTSSLTEGTWHSFVERTRLYDCMCTCNNSRDTVMYGHATQTSITVVSKFPIKNLGSHARMNSGYQALFSEFFLSAWERRLHRSSYPIPRAPNRPSKGPCWKL